jgi:hypothetical protein
MNRAIETVENLIEQSVRTNSIVTISRDAEIEFALSCASEDEQDCILLNEYWGTDENGNEWRIHVSK